jgi:hypothetical protein
MDMNWNTMLFVAMLAICTLAYAQDEGPVAYQPDKLGVGRLFLVALRVPTGTPQIAITVPEQVELLDRTPLPTTNEIRKYYFRTLEAADQADIVFAHPDGPVTVSVEIWSYEGLREFRELKGVQLPRRWPLGENLPELKEGRTVITPEREKSYRGDPGKGWLEMTDDEIWSLQPDSTIPRWHWVNISNGCPVHGGDIYHGRDFYPWRDELDKPIRTYSSAVLPYAWKIKCPVGEELYPSNDFGNFDFTSGDFPDDGIGGGYIAPDGKHYGFIAETAQSYAHKMLNVAPACAQSYLATGNIEYVHKALVAFSRLAVEWSYLATMTHHRHRNNVGQVERLGQSRFEEGPFLNGAGFTVYCIDQPGYQRRHAEAYDMIWPAIEQDDDIIPFLHSKGLTHIQTHEDLRRFIEEDLMAVWMQGAMDGATASNQPYSQWGLVGMAECLNYERGNEFMDWLYDDPRGQMRYFTINTYFRDGAPYESTGGYNSMHVTAIGPVIEGIERLRALRPEVYPNEKYPNFTDSRAYRNIYDFVTNTVNIDRLYPRVGDVGSYPKYSLASKITWNSASARCIEHAYEIFQHPKFAWALANAPGWNPSEQFPYTREQIEAAAAEWPDDWNDASCVQDGYGLAMLRSGEDINKRSLWMMYGRARGHTHQDMLHMGLDAYQSEILGHMGYPRNWSAWEGNWMTQNQARQIPFVNMTGQAQLFADAGVAHVGEVFAQAFSDQVAQGEGYQLDDDNWQRRMLAIVDVSDEQFYCLDLYRIFGGDEHWWTLHCQEGEFSTEGLNLVAQPTGTLAGPDVPYGDEQWQSDHGGRKGVYGWSGQYFAFPHLYNVQRDTTADRVWSADWELEDSDGLHFRMTVPPVDGAQVIICDGQSPAGASPYEMKWVLLNKEADAPVATQVANIMELYRGNPVVKSVSPLEVSGSDESDFPAYGLVVELNNGRVDTIFASSDGTTTRTAPGGFEFAGRFGLFSEENGEVTHISLLGGTQLTRDGVGVQLAAAEYRAQITATDRKGCSITVSPAPANPGSLEGKYIHIVNEHRRLVQKVERVETIEDAVVLHLEFDPLVGIGQISGHDAGLVKTSTPFHLRGMRYYHGARVGNAAGDVEYRIDGIAGGAFVDATVHGEVSAERLAAEFPIDTWFNVYDYGVGDEVVLPHVVSVSRTGQAAVFQVATTDDVTLSLPEGTTAEAGG